MGIPSFCIPIVEERWKLLRGEDREIFFDDLKLFYQSSPFTFLVTIKQTNYGHLRFTLQLPQRAMTSFRFLPQVSPTGAFTAKGANIRTRVPDWKDPPQHA